MLTLRTPMISIIILLIFVSGCDHTPQKTDSMLFREKAYNDADIAVTKAETLLSQEVLAAPMDNLDTLIIVNDAVKEAINIYKKRNIQNWKHPKLSALQASMQSLQPELIQSSLALIKQLIERTESLRTQIQDAKNLPFSARDQNTDEMVGFLASRYQKEIEQCCMVKLGRVDHLLNHDYRKHKPLLIMIRSMYDHLTQVIRDPEFAQELKTKLSQLERHYNAASN